MTQFGGNPDMGYGQDMVGLNMCSQILYTVEHNNRQTFLQNQRKSRISLRPEQQISTKASNARPPLYWSNVSIF